MKRIVSVFLVCALCLSGCAQSNVTVTDVANNTDSVAEKVEEAIIDATSDIASSENTSEEQNAADIVIDDSEADPTPYKYKAEFDSLDD